MKATPGIEIRHARGCAGDERCTCKPTFRAWVYDRRAGRKLRQTFPTLSAAKAWRADTVGDVRRGTRQATPTITVRQAAAELVEGMQAGTVRNRSGRVYKPSVIRGYRRSLDDRIVPELGALKLSDVRRQDVQRLVDELLARGGGDQENPKPLDASTVRNIVMPLRVMFRRAVEDGVVALSPTASLRLPAVEGKRDRVATPAEMATLIAALPEKDRALWGTAAYAGLRLGELRALRWDDVDLERNLIQVVRGWDPAEGVIETKSRAGRRTVPIAKVLRELLIRHRLLTGRSDGYVFGRKASEPFTPTSVAGRAATAWKKLEGLTLHEARHTFASLMIAAGVNAKALQSFMGHSSITVTMDRYGHLMPGSEAEAADLLDAYLERVARGPVVGQLGQSSGGFQRS